MNGTKLEPKPGEVVVVSTIPACNFCQDGTPGPYDFKTKQGPWANGCETHWQEHRASADLGVGKGQLWVTADQIDQPTETTRWDDAEVISVYTRGQAVEDGVLVSLDDEPLIAETGFNCSVALTRGLFDLVTPTEAERERYGQSYTGRLWDVLNMARMYSRGAHDRDTAGEGVDVFFPCIFTICGRDDVTTRSGAKFTGQKTHKLWFSLARGDDGEPVVTIGFPGDR